MNNDNHEEIPEIDAFPRIYSNILRNTPQINWLPSPSF